MTDRLILARYSEVALGSMQISGPVGWITTTLFGSFSVGMASYIGQCWGADRKTDAERYLGGGLSLSLFMGVVLAALGVRFAPDLCDAMADGSDVTIELRSLAMLYLYYLFPCAPFQIMSGALTSAHQAIGNTRWPMFVTLGAGVINLGVSAILVHGLFGFASLGVEGAAIGSVSAFIFAFLANLAPMLWTKYDLTIRRPSRRDFQEVIERSLPALSERTLYHGAYLIFCGFIGHLGNEAMTVHQALIALESFGFISAHAFGVAAFTLSAQFVGANSPELAKTALRRTTHLGVGLLTVFGLFLIVFSFPLMELFVQTNSSLELGATCLTVVACVQPMMAITDIFSGAHRGAGDTLTPMWAAVMGPVFVRLVSCWIFAFELNLGLVGIWLGSSLDWVVRTLYLSVRIHRGKWLWITKEAAPLKS